MKERTKKKNKSFFDKFSKEELNLIDFMNTSYLTLDDIKWLKSKWWFKRFLKKYSKELKKRYNERPIIETKLENKVEIETLDFTKTIKIPKEEIVEILDFTQTIKIPNKEIVEVLDFTKTIDISDIKKIVDTTDNTKKRIKLEMRIWSFVIIICVIALIGLLVSFVNWNLENSGTTDILEDVYEVADVKVVTTTTQNISPEENNTIQTLYEKYGSMEMLEADFKSLKTINEDVVGWINVPGTKINYPFVQTKDNEYYLKHSLDKSSNKKGWVFMDFRNDIDYLSKNTILYAHGLNNNQMFGSMRNVVKESWFKNKNNRIVKISTENSNQLWEIFSTYTILPETYYIKTRFESEKEYKDFIKKLKSRSYFDFDVNVTSEDKILTLSSCYNNEKRMVLHAKLISYQSR